MTFNFFVIVWSVLENGQHSSNATVTTDAECIRQINIRTNFTRPKVIAMLFVWWASLVPVRLATRVTARSFSIYASDVASAIRSAHVCQIETHRISHLWHWCSLCMSPRPATCTTTSLHVRLRDALHHKSKADRAKVQNVWPYREHIHLNCN